MIENEPMGPFSFKAPTAGFSASRIFQTLCALWLGLFATAVGAQTPVAIVEHVQSKTAAVEFMDYLAAGRVIKLASADVIVLGYMKSCWRERISAGTITVGLDQSSVAGGKVERTKVACDPGKMRLSSEQAQRSGAMTFRGAPGSSGLPTPDLTIHALSPVVEVKTPGKLIFERLDSGGEKLEIEVAAHSLLRGAFFDLAKAGKSLKAGGIYRARMGESQLVFEVDGFALSGEAPIIGRLLRLAPAN